MVQKYPARKHARKVALELGKLIPEEERSKLHGIFIQSAPGAARFDTDRELPYHQEANFSYLTGCPTQSASLFAVFSFPSAPDLTHINVHHHLLVPEADPLETMWSVAPPTLAEAKDLFDSDNVTYTTDTLDALKQAAEQTSAFGKGKFILHTLPNTLEFPPLPESVSEYLSKGTVERKTDLLLQALHLARLTKDEFEIKLIREANRISSGAHEVLMRELGRFAEKRKGGKVEPGVRHRTGREGVSQWEVESENDAEALFVATCKRSGAGQAYLPICASGSRASTLHYVCNDRLFPSTAPIRQPGDTSFKPRPLARGCCGGSHDPHEDEEVEPEVPVAYHDGAFEPQVLLIDAGCEWKDYASDITRTIPVGNGGKFTEKAGQIYELVLRMQKECEDMVKPGAHWDLLHLHAHRVLVDGFLALGIFEGDAEDIIQSGITAAFLPHGLGHSLGMDVHDSRQLLRDVQVDIPEESKKTPSKLYTYLRIRRPLERGMVLTVEPGCYFAPQLMDEHKVWESKFVNKDKLKAYVPVGGVRIEDVVVVRDGQCENLTTLASMVTKLLSGAVVSEHTRASEVGTRILANGGNAADAIVATIFAVNTLAMYHSDLGGGGFAIIRTAEGNFESLNFRHCAPKASTAEFYKDKSTAVGGPSVAVPGEVRGLFELHERYGRLPWKELFAGAIAIARDGQVLQGDLLAFVENELPGEKKSRKGTYMEKDKMYDIYFDANGDLLPSGSTFKRVEYAKALEKVAEGGADAFYTGEIAQGIVDAVQASGGLMTLDDLRVQWNKPISSSYKSYKLWTVPAPASGAIWLNAMGILGQFGTEGTGTITDLHRLTEALRLAYGTRTQLGDPAFVTGLEEAQKIWTSPEFAKERAELVDDAKTHPPDYYKPPKVEIKNTNGTSNITVADSDGLVISITTTVGQIFGSRIITRDGIVLNDSMDDFSVAGRPNGWGYEPSPANYIVGGKRPLSSSCPFIIVDSHNRPVLAGGAAGGSTIISANTQLARNVLDYGMTAAEAQRTSRLHNQVLPNVSLVERSSTHQGITIDGFSKEQITGLEGKGHKIEWINVSRSTTCAIRFEYDDGNVSWEPAGEPRKYDSGGSVYTAQK